MTLPSASVIILTYKSYTHKGGSVEHVLQSILNQKFVEVECIIVENSGFSADRDALNKHVNDIIDTQSIFVIETDLARGAARNEGVKHASNDLIFFIDDDTILLNDEILYEVCLASTNYKYGFGAKRYWTLPYGWFEKNSKSILEHLSAVNYSVFTNHLGAPSFGERGSLDQIFFMILQRSLIANFGFVSRDAFQCVNGFLDSMPDEAGSEDIILTFELYLKYGRPLNLQNYTVCHVYHKLRYDKMPIHLYDKYSEDSRQHYNQILKMHNISAFNILPLLFSEYENMPVLYANGAPYILHE